LEREHKIVGIQYMVVRSFFFVGGVLGRSLIRIDLLPQVQNLLP